MTNIDEIINVRRTRRRGAPAEYAVFFVHGCDGNLHRLTRITGLYTTSILNH
jgi:hypothetical protein